MTYHARDWLPYGVMYREPVRRGVEAAVSDWARRWFASGRIGVSNLLVCSTDVRGELEGGAWRVTRQGIALDIPRRSLQSLVEKGLATSESGEQPTETDRQLLTEFERRLIDDLSVTLAAQLSLPHETAASAWGRDPFGGKGGLVVRLSDGNGPDLAALAIPFEILLPFCRASLGPSDSPKGDLEGLLHALASIPVMIEATLGHFDLGLSELQELAVGDVLLMNRPLGDAFDLTIAGGQRVLGRAEMQSANGSLAFVLQA
ncbi:MAG TPA: FliM/FliN family flagellar motor switch protein [Caulobacteraceae bacterium]|nr:FliM/FliN family flagellar motor switch protein [Caulobacteraceae bacterium]